MTEKNFPLLDAPRTTSDSRFNRIIIDSFGSVEPYVEETDSWISMPVRLIHDDAGGFQLEVGPYSFSRADVDRLHWAIAGFEAAAGRDA